MGTNFELEEWAFLGGWMGMIRRRGLKFMGRAVALLGY
jgi:hypothetical protein